MGSNQHTVKGARAGRKLAKALVAWLDLMYNPQTALRVLHAVLVNLQDGKEYFEKLARKAQEKQDERKATGNQH